MNAYQRSMRAKQSKVEGDYFEAMIESSLEWYESQGIACVEKTPEPMKPLSRPNSRGQFLACFTKAAQPDFKGTLLGGRCVVFDAKHTNDDRIEYRAVTKEQREKLELHDKLGAASFVLVSFGLGSFYRIPWGTWRDMKEIYGRQYIKRDEIPQYKVPLINGYLKMLIDL